MFPELHTCYTRDRIHDELGGSKQYYLPHVRGRIVAACLKRRANPDAPEIILPGVGDVIERNSERLRDQGGSIPVFIKRGVNRWEYVGDYEVESWSDDPVEIAAQQARSRRRNITAVIRMRPAHAPALATV
jgi:hypothetical protein